MLLSMACIGLGQRDPSSLEQAQGNLVPLKSLTKMMLALENEAAFNSAVLGKQLPIRSSTRGILRPRTLPSVMQKDWMASIADSVSGAVGGLGDKAKETLGLNPNNNMTTEEVNALEDRLKAGEMTFDDFLKQMDMIQKGSAVKSMLSKFGGGSPEQIKQLEESQKNLIAYRKYVEVMDEEEKENPSLLMDEIPNARAKGDNCPRIQRIAEATDETVESVGKFVMQFKMMRIAAGRFASGENPDDIRREMQAEAEESAPPMNRKQKRYMNKKMKKKRKVGNF